MTSKERAALRAQANTIDTTLMVGKGGVSETLVAEAEKLLDIHELVKGRVLETAMMTPREVCDALCEATGAEAKRIVFGKYLNCGQTCVAPDYILCDKRIRDELITAILAEIEKQFGKEPLKNPNYGKIINEKHFERILGLINGEKLVYGGQSEPESLRIAPTVLNNITWDDAVMGEEIFGPLLPILTFDTLNEALDTVESHPHPLALYFFSEDKAAQKKVLDTCRFGGGCINDTIIHLATSDMPFGGVGESGMGSYHGRVGFETFSHYRSIVDKKTWMDLPIRYQKYTGLKEKMMRM